MDLVAGPSGHVQFSYHADLNVSMLGNGGLLPRFCFYQYNWTREEIRWGRISGRRKVFL